MVVVFGKEVQPKGVVYECSFATFEDEAVQFAGVFLLLVAFCLPMIAYAFNERVPIRNTSASTGEVDKSTTAGTTKAGQSRKTKVTEVKKEK